MRKPYEYYKRDYWSFGIAVRSPYERERHEKPYCTLNIQLFKHSWWWKIPELFKPKEKWIDTTDMSWNKDKEGPHGFMEEIRKEYGFTFTPDGLHVYYGIQPGNWSRNDPENSDHSKLFWYPWQLTIVRHDLLYPNGDVYHRNTYPRKKYEPDLHWYEVFDWPRQEDKNRVESQVAKFVELDHWTKDGKNQKAKIRLAGEEREWRPKCTRWLPIFRKISRVVDCNSDTELGPRAGSWKGGMIGWSCEWKEDEDMRDAFWRWYKKWDGQ
jgi:hypothetical protein